MRTKKQTLANGWSMYRNCGRNNDDLTAEGKVVDVDFIFKIAAIGIIVTVLNQLLVRSGREEQAMLTTLAGLVVVLLMVVGAIADLFDTVKGLFGL